MRHLNDRRQLGRNSPHRKAMFRNMATSMLIHGRIKTTQAKAKELRRVVEKLITMGKRYHTLGPVGEDKQIAAKKLHLHRQALSYLKDKKAIEVLLNDLPARFDSRQGGYTRIIKLGPRIGDAAPMAYIELVGEQEAPEGKDKKRRRRSGRKKIKAEAEKMVKGTAELDENIDDAQNAAAEGDADGSLEIDVADSDQVPEDSAAPELESPAAEVSDQESDDLMDDATDQKEDDEKSDKE